MGYQLLMLIYYKTNNRYSSATGVIKDVDIRSEGGYIVLPPSYHENGNRYRWIEDFSINKIVPANDVVNKFLSFAGNKSSIIDLAVVCRVKVYLILTYLTS